MKILKSFSKAGSSLSNLCILSAARTPVGLLNGGLSDFTATQLVSFAIREALQRAAVPAGYLQNVFLGCFGYNDCHEEIIKRTGLKKSTKVSLVSTCGMKSLIQAFKFLLDSNDKVCLAGGMGSVTNLPSTNAQVLANLIKTTQEDSEKLLKWGLKFVQQDYNNFKEANKNGAFSEEILKIDFRKKGQQIVVAADEVYITHNLPENDFLLPVPGDGAACLIISGADYAKKNTLVPLAKIISFSEECADAKDLASVHCLAIEKALKTAGCECKEIARWEMVSSPSNTIFKVINYFNINCSDVNKDGGVLSLGCPVGMSGVRALCHLVHSLSAEELGCVASCDLFGTVSAVIVKKSRVRDSTKPWLRLYTKHPCPLCDELKEELKPFEGRYSLEEVDIETKEYEKYKELYQYEIPVLFLDGVFLCKHRLDVERFKRQLLAYEKSLV